MIKVYRNLGAYRPEFALSTWIYRIASNHVLDWMRRERHWRGSEPPGEELADSGESPSERLAGRERAERVREALRELPATYRLPLVLMHVEGRSVDEIARILSLPSNTVKTRLARGRTRLAEVLRRRCPDLMPRPVEAKS
jgi:RNA polymerase sigma-70 factor (ECF subfamily)